MKGTLCFGKMNCLYLLVFICLISSPHAAPSYQCPSSSFLLYPSNGEVTNPVDDIALFDSGKTFTSNNSKLDSSPCTSIHPKAKIVMIRSNDMAAFIFQKITQDNIWSGAYKEAFSTDPYFGWLWMDGVNTSARPIVWRQYEPNDKYGNERTFQWWRYPDGHVDVPSGYSAKMICEVKGNFLKSFCLFLTFFLFKSRIALVCVPLEPAM
jgi:hypothetical protein